MGLDQYLYAKKTTFPDDFFGVKRQAEHAELKKILADDADVMTKNGHIAVEMQIGYWRKANAIHQFFVDNCQGGVDDCREAYVRRETLIELKGLCETILKDKSLAEGHLPPASGFFFGSTDIDEWYFEALQETVTMLTKALELGDEWGFAYQSSW